MPEFSQETEVLAAKNIERAIKESKKPEDFKARIDTLAKNARAVDNDARLAVQIETAGRTAQEKLAKANKDKEEDKKAATTEAILSLETLFPGFESTDPSVKALKTKRQKETVESDKKMERYEALKSSANTVISKVDFLTTVEKSKDFDTYMRIQTMKSKVTGLNKYLELYRRAVAISADPKGHQEELNALKEEYQQASRSGAKGSEVVPISWDNPNDASGNKPENQILRLIQYFSGTAEGYVFSLSRLTNGKNEENQLDAPGRKVLELLHGAPAAAPKTAPGKKPETPKGKPEVSDKAVARQTEPAPEQQPEKEVKLTEAQKLLKETVLSPFISELRRGTSLRMGIISTMQENFRRFQVGQKMESLVGRHTFNMDQVKKGKDIDTGNISGMAGDVVVEVKKIAEGRYTLEVEFPKIQFLSAAADQPTSKEAPVSEGRKQKYILEVKNNEIIVNANL